MPPKVAVGSSVSPNIYFNGFIQAPLLTATTVLELSISSKLDPELVYSISKEREESSTLS
jgi:hypothetical protein